jgi:hypothetical protein
MTFLSPRRGLCHFSARGFSHRATVAGHSHKARLHPAQGHISCTYDACYHLTTKWLFGWPPSAVPTGVT